MIKCEVCKSTEGELKFEAPFKRDDYLPLPKCVFFNFYCMCGHRTENRVTYDPKKPRRISS